MPGGDRTGPQGLGPMTGRRAGYCTGNTSPGFANSWSRGGYGFGGGGGRGGGRGYRNRFYATGLTGWQRGAWSGPQPWVNPQSYEGPYGYSLSKDEEVTMLKEQATNMERGLTDIKKRIQELDSGPEKS